MQTNKSIRMLLVSASLLGLGGSAQFDTVPPPERKDLTGAWIGFDQDYGHFCRLELDGSGSGICSVTYLRNPPVLHVVQSWSLEDFKISFELTPVDGGAEPISLKGEANKSVMLLEIASKATKWKRKLNLVRDEDLADQNQKAKEKIQRFKLDPKNKK